MNDLFGFIFFAGLIVFVVYRLHRPIGKALFGRTRSPFVRLTEPPELLRDIWHEPKQDEIVKQLSNWRPANQTWPEWNPLWLRPSAGSHKAKVEEVEALFRPISTHPLPYELLDDPPNFPKKNSLPPQPQPIPEDYPEPILSLPLWPARYDFLNFYVMIAHQELTSRKLALKNKRAELIDSAKILNAARNEAWTQASERHRAYEKAKAAFEKDRDKDLRLLRSAKQLSLKCDPSGIEQHFDLWLRQFALPLFVPRQWNIRYEAETKILLLEHQFPETARLELVKVVQQSRGLVEKPVSQTVRKTVVPKIQPALCIQLARGIAEADSFGVVDAVAVNGWVDFFDRATGHPKRAYCASLVTKKETLLGLHLETADPVSVFNSLCGANAGETYEISPVLPSLRLQTDDPRFIQSKEIIERMAKGENLAAMEWEDFEHLVRELFQREFAANGGEVKITRASRDLGVDAIIFDPDPLKGGKIVIQAKRYTIPVDVSAVRDLYGTVLNEGANGGILVTTSHYGSEAYEFVQNKPLKLINGAQLLGLLEKAGYRFRIDIAEARALAKQQ